MSIQEFLEKMVAGGSLQRDEPTTNIETETEFFDKIKASAEAKRQEYALQLKNNPFLAQYSIPFAFSLEIKERLSGLSANSGGNGWSRNTKIHVYSTENGFICANSKSKWGANWSGTLGEGYYNGAAVDCAACLKKIEKYKI